jgi:endonuclease/exonuclease/phosphatase family metal-dependent hydrolase
MRRHLKTLCLLLTAMLLSCPIFAQEMLVGTYNIRNKNNGDSIRGEVWGKRCQVICDQVKFMAPAIFGTQEVLHGQLQDLLHGLRNYSSIGVGRDDGKTGGEYAAIFYDKNRLRLLDHGDFWLNETPDRPALGWDAACVRICTWGHFRDRETEKEFFFLNLHMDHVGVKARSESAKLVMKFITEMTDGGKKLAVLTGDFNVPQTDELYSLFTESGVLKDCYTAAQLRFAENGTYNGFDYHFFTDERIDHIFVTPDTKVEAYAVLTDGRWQKDMNHRMSRRNLSDHYPIFARIRF